MTAPEIEKKDLLDTYRVQLDVWKVQNDNYFRRVQILMVAIQAALFATALKVLDIKVASCTKLQVLIFLAILGVISAQMWMGLNEKQNHYMEFCRRTLRNLEHRLTELGVPLRYFTLESHVFGPMRIEVTNLAGTSVRTEKGKHVAEFVWSRERYPDQDTDNKDIHELAKVDGGMISFERDIAFGIRMIWILGLVIIVAKMIA